MKIARAKSEDINALCDLAFAIDAIKEGNIPLADSEEEEWKSIGSTQPCSYRQRRPSEK